MANYRKGLGIGILFGLAAGALWAAGRYYSRVAPPRLINWGLARTTAARVLRNAPPVVPWDPDERHQLYARLVQQSQELIGAFSGETTAKPLGPISVLDRIEWVEANLANFQLLFEPLEQTYAQLHEKPTVGIHLAGHISQMALSTQLGALLGYLAQRVLGQYDISIMGREPITGGQLYFVEPNIATVERLQRLPGYEFRHWITLHEVTHALEFETHPWVLNHMNDLLRRYIATLATDMLQPRSGLASLGTFITRVRANLFRTRYLLEMLMSPEQQQLFRQLQALMSLLEGYSNYVMEGVGETLIHNYGLFKQRFEARLQLRTPAEQLFARLTGLDIKMEQYRLGEQFVRSIVVARGLPFLRRVWTGPEALPSLAELEQPQRWIARIESQPIALPAHGADEE